MPAPTVPADAIALLARTGPRHIINYLVKHPGSYCGDVREATNNSVSSLTRDLRLLEDIGVVRTDVEQPVGARRGRAPPATWSTTNVSIRSSSSSARNYSSNSNAATARL